MHPFTKFKEENKKLAAQIRELKLWRKKKYCENNTPIPEEVSSRTGWATNYSDSEWSAILASGKGKDYRCRHVAYCELRGRTREQIEPKIKDEGSYEARVRERKIQEYRDQLQADLGKWNKQSCIDYENLGPKGGRNE